MATKVKDQAQDLTGAAPESLNLSDAEVADARAEGAKEAVKESAKDAYTALTDGNLPSDIEPAPYHGSDESQQYAFMIDFGIDQLTEMVEKKDSPVTDTMAAGLLNLERNGQNRTPYVKLLMKRLGLKGRDELRSVAPGGPDYTNDLTNITDL